VDDFESVTDCFRG